MHLRTETASGWLWHFGIRVGRGIGAYLLTGIPNSEGGCCASDRIYGWTNVSKGKRTNKQTNKPLRGDLLCRCPWIEAYRGSIRSFEKFRLRWQQRVRRSVSW